MKCDAPARNARGSEPPTEAALLYVRDFEREPSSHHKPPGVANFDNQIAGKSVTVGNRQLVPQHVGKGIGGLVLHFIHGGKFRSLFVGN